MENNEIIKIVNLKAGYVKGNNILQDVSLTISRNEVVAVVGKNGAGKSTLAKAILNITPFIEGEINFKNKVIFNNNKKYGTSEIINFGIGYFMQGGEIFSNLTIEENLKFAGIKLGKNEYKKKLNKTKSNFDLLSNNNRIKMKASYLSGGEQHQLALAMVMMRNPELLILDEPSAGLSPHNRNKLFESINKIKQENDIGILLIEQNVKLAVDFSDRIFKLDLGKFVKEERSENLKELKNLDSFFWD